jgi:hypothetical protein
VHGQSCPGAVADSDRVECVDIDDDRVEFDPDEWSARLRAGTPAAEFLPRRVHQPVSPLRGAAAQPA